MCQKMIRVISRKVPKCDSIHFGIYVNKLSELVKIQPGFITSDSYWCRESNNVFSVSDWKIVKDCETWKVSQCRQTIFKTHSNYIQEEHHRILHKTNSNFNNFFLL